MEKIKLCCYSLQKLKKIKSSSIHYRKHELDSFMRMSDKDGYDTLWKIAGNVPSRRKKTFTLVDR